MTAPLGTAAERRAARIAADNERIDAAGRTAEEAAPPPSAAVAARVAAVLRSPEAARAARAARPEVEV